MLQAAVDAVRAGGLVAFPTETVWGIACDASNPLALAKLYALKARPSNQPMTLHLGPSANPRHWGQFSPAALSVANAYWPGPLTLIVPAVPNCLIALTGGTRNIGIRVPSHPAAAKLLDALNCPMVATSANRKGASPCANAAEVVALLPEVDAIYDRLPLCAGLSSTILALVAEPHIVRAGFISRHKLEQALGQLIIPAPST